MAARKIYYDLTLKKDKIKSMTISLDEVMETFGVKSHPHKTSIEDTVSVLLETLSTNRTSSSTKPQLLSKDDRIVIGYAISLEPLIKAVDEAKIYIELCPFLIKPHSVELLPTDGFRLGLMIRYYKDPDFIKFTEIIDSIYDYK